MDIYYIHNTANEKLYIGLTTKSYHDRCKEHFKALRGGYHANIFLQRAYSASPDTFETGSFLEGVEEVTSLERLQWLEEAFIKEYNTTNMQYGYNLTQGGECNIPTPENLEIRSQAHRGKSPSEDTRKKISASLKGRPLSEDTKQKMSKTRTNMVRSEETRKKISEAIKTHHRAKQSQ